MKLWQMEYYNAFPNIRVMFVVEAETFEEAVRKGDAAAGNLRRVGTWETTRERAVHS